MGNVQFQKISIPTPWKVNGNSEGVGGLKSKNFERKVWGLTGNSRGVGGIHTKKLSMGGVWIFSGATQFDNWKNNKKGGDNKKKRPPAPFFKKYLDEKHLFFFTWP